MRFYLQFFFKCCSRTFNFRSKDLYLFNVLTVWYNFLVLHTHTTYITRRNAIMSRYGTTLQNVTRFPSGAPLGRSDMLGDFVMRYSDDGGATWSKEHYTVPNPLRSAPSFLCNKNILSSACASVCIKRVHQCLQFSQLRFQHRY